MNASFDFVQVGPSRSSVQTTIEAVLQRFRADLGEPRPQLPREIARILKTIHERLFDPLLNVQNIKISCRIQDNNVSSRFKHEMGISIKEYLDTLRLEAARTLLTSTELSIFDVGQAVGYCHPQTFYRVFHRKFGRTPGDVRRLEA